MTVTRARYESATAPFSHPCSAREKIPAAIPVAMGTRQSIGRLFTTTAFTSVIPPTARIGPVVLDMSHCLNRSARRRWTVRVDCFERQMYVLLMAEIALVGNRAVRTPRPTTGRTSDAHPPDDVRQAQALPVGVRVRRNLVALTLAVNHAISGQPPAMVKVASAETADGREFERAADFVQRQSHVRLYRTQGVITRIRWDGRPRDTIASGTELGRARLGTSGRYLAANYLA